MDVRESRAVLSQLWSTALFVGPLLFAARAFGAALPFGWVTLVLGANAALMATQIDAYTMIPGVVAAGLCADLLYQGLKPSAGREAAFRVFAFATPALYWIFHDITLAATRQHFYVSVHLWTGLVVIAGLVGLLASFLAPPQMSSYE
jgi:hypothetical protein